MMEQSNIHIKVIKQPKEFENFMKKTNQFHWSKSSYIAMHFKNPIIGGKGTGNVLGVANGPWERQLKNSNQILGRTK